MRGGLLAALLCVVPAGWCSAAAAAEQRVIHEPTSSTPATSVLRAPAQAALKQTGHTETSVGPSVLVAFLPPGPSRRSGQSEDDAIEAELSSIPTLSIGILSATQGAYDADQMLLDMTQGARVSYSAYSPARPPSLSSLELDLTTEHGLPASAHISSWPAALRRAQGAPQLLKPGLLATSIPGGAAYAAPYFSNLPGSGTIEVEIAKPVSSPATVDWPLAANRSGRIAALSFGSSGTLLARIGKLRATHSLVVADLPQGASGYSDLRSLTAARSPRELLVVIQSAPNLPGHELLWSAFAGLGSGGDTLTSQSTNQRGMIAAIDIGPTILGHLGLPIPADMRGKPVRLDGAFDGASLRALKARLVVIDSRRLPALAWLALAWAFLLIATRLSIGDANRGQRTGWAMRVGAIALLWAPVAVLLPAALEPSRTVEFALIVATCFALGALTDLLVPWPRAPLVPAVVAVVALTVDALAGTQLLMRSLLGPSPAFGARFYGIGNELKSGLAVLVFTAVAAALYPAARSRRAAVTMAGAGILLAIVEGSARIGAGVGGVILVSAGTAVATVMLLPGTLNRKRVLIVMAAPVLGLIALAAIDLATAHGSGHFTGSVLDARSPGDIRDIVVRRYSAAWDELKNHLMPLATALASIASFIAVRRRDRVLAPVASDPVWLAAFAGGLTSGVIGALTEDSGPVLLVVAVGTLGCVLSYLWGKPARAQPVSRRSPSTLPAARSHARTRSAAPSG
ncbi:MAG TPA: hypothetical protein VK730_05650 [Solirubrobacteraceae bacterium]|jgi:hypothetical protein|nr:hypothetical protein [Solirubrobacteraceae bacterium]